MLPELIIVTETKWAATWDFQQCGILTSVDSEEPVKPHFKLTNSKWWKNIKGTSKGSDQTARMRRLVWAFDGLTYHIVGNPMLWLKSSCELEGVGITQVGVNKYIVLFDSILYI